MARISKKVTVASSEAVAEAAAPAKKAAAKKAAPKPKATLNSAPAKPARDYATAPGGDAPKAEAPKTQAAPTAESLAESLVRGLEQHVGSLISSGVDYVAKPGSDTRAKLDSALKGADAFHQEVGRQAQSIGSQVEQQAGALAKRLEGIFKSFLR